MQWHIPITPSIVWLKQDYGLQANLYYIITRKWETDIGRVYIFTEDTILKRDFFIIG